MSPVRTKRRATRPVAAATTVLALVLSAAAASCRSASELPPVSAASLIASTVHAIAHDRPMSGSIQLSVDLGFPQVVDLGSQSGPLGLLGGTHELKLWRSPDGLRISDLESTGERALFVSHGRAWAWDFESLTAYDLGRIPSPSGSIFGLLGAGITADGVHEMLDEVSDSTRVGVSGETTVAGQPTYRLVIAPRQAGTLVGAVEIDIDARTRMPLGLSIFGRNQETAAISVRFSSVSFDSIDPSVFDFEPPPGAQVKRVGIEGGDIDRVLALTQSLRTFGSGWTSVMAVRVPPIAQGGIASAFARGFLHFQGSLVSVAVAGRGDHAWVLVGTIPLARLESFESRLT
jgi:outer membrane lipoprotein-sorting protein